MGEMHRARMRAIRESQGWRGRPITEAQARTLRDLCVEQDGEVDEAWLAGLTRGEASAEIERRIG